MCFYIGVEDLVANAMVEMPKKDGQPFLTYDEIEIYGAGVVRVLKEKGEEAALMLSRENTDIFFREYPEFFEEVEQNGERGIKLKAGKGMDDLIQQFRGYLALDVLLAFMDQRAVQLLGQGAVSGDTA